MVTDTRVCSMNQATLPTSTAATSTNDGTLSSSRARRRRALGWSGHIWWFRQARMASHPAATAAATMLPIRST